MMQTSDTVTLRRLRSAPPRPAEADFVLVVVEGPDRGLRVILDAARPRVLLGQSPACGVRLRDPEVSSRHATLSVSGEGLKLIDLGSTNGTTINGVVVKEATLWGGEAISIGGTVLAVGRAGQDGEDFAAPALAERVEAESAPDAEDAPLAGVDLIATIIEDDLPFPTARDRVVKEFERRYVERVLARHGGNVTRAARASGVAHRYFQLIRARLR